MMANTKSSDNTGSGVDGLDQKASILPATQIDPSGAPVQIVPDVDMSHPAVDANPRQGSTVGQNRIDFNDPSKSSSQAVAEMLNAQGVPTKADD